MPHSPPLAPCWTTSSMGHPADMSEQESTALAEHMSLCAALREPLLPLGDGISWLRKHLARRSITAFALITVLVPAGWRVF